MTRHFIEKCRVCERITQQCRCFSKRQAHPFGYLSFLLSQPTLSLLGWRRSRTPSPARSQPRAIARLTSHTDLKLIPNHVATFVCTIGCIFS